MTAPRNTEQLRKALRSAARRRAKVDAELLALIPEAVRAGISKSEVAALAGFSRQGIYDLLRKNPTKE